MKTAQKTKSNDAFAVSSPRNSVSLVEAPPKTSARRSGNGVSGKPIQPVAEAFPALEEQEVTFTFFGPQAKEVKVAGNFNGWNPDATPLKKQGQGEWSARLKLRSGQYEYRFVVDGQWGEDPRTSHHLANPFGSFNSVLTVLPAVRTPTL